MRVETALCVIHYGKAIISWNFVLRQPDFEKLPGSKQS